MVAVGRERGGLLLKDHGVPASPSRERVKQSFGCTVLQMLPFPQQRPPLDSQLSVASRVGVERTKFT